MLIFAIVCNTISPLGYITGPQYYQTLLSHFPRHRHFSHFDTALFISFYNSSGIVYSFENHNKIVFHHFLVSLSNTLWLFIFYYLNYFWTQRRILIEKSSQDMTLFVEKDMTLFLRNIKNIRNHLFKKFKKFKAVIM